MERSPVKKIAVFGNGLAGMFCVAKLSQILPDSVELLYIEAGETSELEALWGTATSPATYDFLLQLGIAEPDLLPSTNTSFSLGTHYKNWGPENREWTQSFYRPLPAYNGVRFHHYLTRLNAVSAEFPDIQSYIMSVQATKSGVFAHPPEGKKIPLADVEYGYHFEPGAWCEVLAEKLKSSSVNWIKADAIYANWNGETLQSVALSTGGNVEADFFIDALGPETMLALTPPNSHFSGRRLKVVSSHVRADALGGVCRILTGKGYGWTSETPLQNGTHILTVFEPDSEAEALADHAHPCTTALNVTLGRRKAPWRGNCLTLGHGAARVEPLTPAPIILLQRDIDRLTELLPVTENMRIESREYNRRFNADYEHADMFQNAFVDPDANSPIDRRLLDKIEQFKSRGVLVQYDYEPFSEQDWTALHWGMQRYPARYDPLADHIPEDQLKNRLSEMRAAIAIMAKKMPPHHIYMTGLLKYLKEKHV